MFHAGATKFDVTGNLENFLVFQGKLNKALVTNKVEWPGPQILRWCGSTRVSGDRDNFTPASRHSTWTWVYRCTPNIFEKKLSLMNTHV